MQVETQEELNIYKKYAFRFSRTYQINLIYVESTIHKSEMTFVEIGADNVGKHKRPVTYAMYNFKHNNKIILNLMAGTVDSYRFFERLLLRKFKTQGRVTPICKLKKYVDI